MPTYTYECQACGHRFQLVREIKWRDAPLQCSNCGEVSAKRQLDAPGFHMRGLNFGDKVKVR
jgi:putative FmdB family regulatory protein